jgi:hypothetical protein
VTSRWQWRGRWRWQWRGRWQRRRTPTVAAILAAVVLVAVMVLVPAAPGWAQAVPDAGFGDQHTVTDGYGNAVWDYELGGLQPRGPHEMGQAFRNLPLAVSAVGFEIIKFLVVAIAWMLGFALRFGIADLLLTPVTEIVALYQSYVDHLGLIPVALMLCVFWFGLAALRGRVGKGVGEITMSFVLVVVLGAVLASPGSTLLGDTGLLGRSKDLGSTLAMLAVQEPAVAWRTADCGRVPAAGEQLPDGCLLADLGARVPDVDDPEVLAVLVEVWLVDMFVRQPHQHIVYGQRIDCPVAVNIRRWGHVGAGDDEPCVPHSCLHRYNAIVAADWTVARALIDAGEADSRADPFSYMYDMMHPDDGGYEFDDGCRDEEALALADFSRGGSWQRVAVTLFTLLTLVVLLLFVAAGIVFPIAIGQIMIAVLIVALVFVLPVALLGGAARQVLWRWVGLLAGALFMVIVALFGLSMMLITLDLLLQTSWHLSISMMLVCFASVVFLAIQRRLLRGGVAGGASLGSALGRAGRSGAVAGAPAGVAGDAGWARASDRALGGATRLVTAAGARENWQRRRALTREAEQQNKVRHRHPEFVRDESFRIHEAQALYARGGRAVTRWRLRRAGSKVAGHIGL